MWNPVSAFRQLLGRTLRSRVAGPDADEKAALIWGSEGERWHSPQDVIWEVNGDAAMYIGGIRSLLLQTLHPSAMAGVAGHSGYRSDPWGRLQRTSEFIALTTYGRIVDAEEVIGKVRRIHERVRGKTDDGIPYRASDPHLLAWVHVAETQSFLESYLHYGKRRLSQAQRDEYVAAAAPVGELLGAGELPRTEAALAATIAGYRPELRATTKALDTVDFILKSPPVPGLARPGYWMLCLGALATLPAWARRELKLPTSPWFDRLVGRPLGRLSTGVVRWALAPESRRDHEGAPPRTGR